MNTPVPSIVIGAARAHDGVMAWLFTPLVDTLLHPAVLAGAALACASLFSGLAARVFELVQAGRPPSRSAR